MYCRLHWRDCETRKNPSAEGQPYERSEGVKPTPKRETWSIPREK